MNNYKTLVLQTKQYVESFFKNNYDGHDYFHTLRVFNMATKIAEEENASLYIVQLAALLHDVDDEKLVGPNTNNALQYLNTTCLSSDDKEHILYIIENQSFKKTFESKESLKSLEAQIVQDADRLDSMGAIGITRTFAYGGSKKRALYDPDILPVVYDDALSYTTTNSPSINHFYEKLLVLKNLMNTKTAKIMANHRHQIMEQFLEEFLVEWDGKK
ncbi:MAG: HD domain-containing protein [Coprobacillaceae bacterium]